jgi:hypothetical protein
VIQKYDDGWSVFGVNVPKQFVNLLGALLAGALLLVVGVVAGVWLTSKTVVLPPPPTPTPIPGPSLDAYADGVSATLGDAIFYTSPNYAAGFKLYVMAYPFNGSGCAVNCHPEPALMGGYTPRCNDPNKQPCFFPSLDPVYGYHDLIAETQGSIDAAGPSAQRDSWNLVVVEYNEAWTVSKTFHPFTSVADLLTALNDSNVASNDFMKLQPSASRAGQYQMPINTVVTAQLIATSPNTAPPPTPTPVPTRVGK